MPTARPAIVNTARRRVASAHRSRPLSRPTGPVGAAAGAAEALPRAGAGCGCLAIGGSSLIALHACAQAHTAFAETGGGYVPDEMRRCQLRWSVAGMARGPYTTQFA